MGRFPRTDDPNHTGIPVELRGLRKSFRGKKVLDGLSLLCEAGKTTVILGRSGGGKSVTLKHIVGLLRPDAGEVLVGGRDVARLPEDELDEVRQDFGMLFQDAALLDSLNVFDNVALPLRLHTKKPKEEIREIVIRNLRLVGLSEDASLKTPSELSGGMRKRVGLARAIALRPRVILYDEPTSGLDPIMTDVINALMMDVQAETGATQIAISHDLAAAFKVAHKIAMLHEGKIIEEGTPEEVQKSQDPVVRQFLEGRRHGPVQVV